MKTDSVDFGGVVLLLLVSVSASVGYGAETIVASAELGRPFQLQVQNDLAYTLNYNRTYRPFFPPLRVTVWCDANSTIYYPTSVSVYEARACVSWQIPLQLGKQQYNQVSRTMCPADSIEQLKNQTQMKAMIHVLTMNPLPTVCHVTADEAAIFFARVGYAVHATFSASQPIYYEILLSNEPVTVYIDSDDQLCAYFAVQYVKPSKSCPIYDEQETLQQTNTYGTFTKKAAVTLSKQSAGEDSRVILIFMLHHDDSPCSADKDEQQQLSSVVDYNRSKTVSFIAKPVTTDYALAIWLPFSIFIIIGLCFVGSEILLWQYYRRRNDVPGAVVSTEMQTPTQERQSDEEDGAQETLNPDRAAPVNLNVNNGVKAKRRNSTCVTHEASLQHLNKRYSAFWKYVIVVTLFYVPPTAQLVASYQRYLTASGNQDVCFYNYRCAHPSVNLTMSNSVWSNMGYVIVGVFLLIIAAIRMRKTRQFSLNGVPEVHGVSLAMGLALIAEGLLSASYHVCPNYSNFQFDITFMLVICALGFVRLHQNRHPDEVTSSTTVFIVVAAAMILFVLDIIWSWSRRLVLWIICWTAGGFFTFLVTTRYYYGWPNFREIKTLISCKFNYKNACNFWGWPPSKGYAKCILAWLYVSFAALYLIGVAFVVRAKQLDFGTYVLGFGLWNLLLYTGFYVTTKVIKQCQGSKDNRWPVWYIAQLVTYILLTLIVWGFALHFFVNPAYSWTYSPAVSREQNEDCIFLSYYDVHDVWHFLSAVALFTTYMVTLNVDDDLLQVQRPNIYK